MNEQVCHALFLADVRPHIFHLFTIFLRTAFDGSEDAITYQCAKHKNAAVRIAPFKIKCAKHMFPKGSIHHLAYDEDVFTCIQNYRTACDNGHGKYVKRR